MVRRDNYFRAKILHQSAAFDRHAFRHCDDQTVFSGGGDHCQTEAGVAAGWFNDDAAGFEFAFAFSRIDHGNRDTVLYA